jgi:ribosome-binding factor A
VKEGLEEQDKEILNVSQPIPVRASRLATLLQSLVMEILQTRLPNDPTLKPTRLFITRVDAADLTQARIWWYPVLNFGEQDRAAVVGKLERALAKAQGKIRYEVTKKLSYLRQSPQLEFMYDYEVDQQDKLRDGLLRNLKEE